MAQRSVYLKNAARLAVSGMVLRLLGMGYRVFLSHRLGTEGMGLYQLVLAVYTVFVALASSGLNVASTRLAAQSLARGRGMAATLRSLCGTALCFGTAAMVLQVSLAGVCARVFLHDIRAEMPLRILAPSLPFLAAAGAVRGCFLAARKVKPNITAQFVEQLVRMATAAVLLGNTVSEAVSCGIMLAFAAKTGEFAPAPDEPLHPYTAKELYAIVLPVEGSRLLAGGLQAAESGLIPYTLTLYTGSRADALAQYGALKGMALPLLFFPFSVLAALSGLLMPEITRAHTCRNMARVRHLVRRMLAVTGVLSLLAGLGFALAGAPLAELLYGDPAVGVYVRHLSAAAPFMYMESMVDGVLKGLGEQLASFRYSLLDSAFRITAILLLLPRCGMGAFLGIMVASNAMTCLLNMNRMRKKLKAAP